MLFFGPLIGLRVYLYLGLVWGFGFWGFFSTSLSALEVLLAFCHHNLTLQQFALAKGQNQHWSLSEQSHSSRCRLEMGLCSKPAPFAQYRARNSL